MEYPISWDSTCVNTYSPLFRGCLFPLSSSSSDHFCLCLQVKSLALTHHWELCVSGWSFAGTFYWGLRIARVHVNSTGLASSPREASCKILFKNHKRGSWFSGRGRGRGRGVWVSASERLTTLHTIVTVALTCVWPWFLSPETPGSLSLENRALSLSRMVGSSFSPVQVG